MEQNPKFTRKISRGSTESDIFSSLLGLDNWEDGHMNETNVSLIYERIENFLKDQNIDLLEKNTKVLEVGSGNSILLDFLRKKGVNAFGLDVRPRGGGKSPKVLARIEQLPFPDRSFKVIISKQVFDSGVYDQNQGVMASEIVRVLKPGGIYIGLLERYELPSIEGFNKIFEDGPWEVVYKKSQ